MAPYIIENATITKDTGKAVLVEAPEFDEPTWIPFSQVHDDSEVWSEGEEGNLSIKNWWAEKEGWL